MTSLKQKFLDFSLEDFIIQRWQGISVFSKKSIFWIFLITNLVFLFYTMTFFWADHDWERLINGVFPITMSGRFFAHWSLAIFGGDILPILNSLFSFFGFSLAVFYLAKYWKIPKTVFSYTTFGLFIILMPYKLSRIWFIWQLADFWYFFFIFYALYLAQKDKWYNHLILSISVFISLGAYQSFYSTVICVFLGKCLLDLFVENLSIQELIKRNYKIGIDIIVAGLMYYVFCYIQKYLGQIPQKTYVNFISMEKLSGQFIKAMLAIRDEFLSASAYMSVLFKRILLLLILLSLFCCFYRKNWKKILFGLLIILVLLLSTQITPILSEKDYFQFIRIKFYTFPFIYALACVILLKQKGIFKSFALGIMLFSIFYSILQDVRCQKVWYLSRQAELGVYQEIITRIHAQPNFNPTKKYKLVLLGRVNTRKYFDKRNDAGNKWDDFRRTFIHGAHPQTFFNFMEQRNYITVFIHDYHSDEWISSLDKNYILSKAKPWPHRESVAIIKDTIYIILEQKKLEQVQKRLNELTTKRTP